MKTIVVKEFDIKDALNVYTLDLKRNTVKDCIGCWSCWWATPGRCVHKDLNEFYRAYINADKAIFYTKVSQCLVSGNLKSLFDRMICLFLPYINYDTGESMHDMRYDRYPDIEVYYDNIFDTDEERKLYEDYMYRVFYQFSSKNILIKPIDKSIIKEAV